jgi:hypothetical protein
MHPSDRQKSFMSEFPLDRRDQFVSRLLNFGEGVPRSKAWWHLRGVAIQWTYVSFWPERQRDEKFKQIVSKMRDCQFGHET